MEQILSGTSEILFACLVTGRAGPFLPEKMKILFWWVLLNISSLYAAAQYRIDARLQGFREGTLFYLKDVEADQVLDSAILKKGTLSIKGVLEDSPRPLWLYTHTADKFYYFNLFIANEKVLVEAKAEDMPYFVRITGSPIQDADNLLNKQTAKLWYSRDSLTGLVVPLMQKNEQPELQAKIWKAVRVIDDSVQTITQKFIRYHINSYAGLRQLYYQRFKMDTSILRRLLTTLQSEFRNSRYARSVETFLRVGAPLKAGNLFRDFEAIDSAGNTHQLSSYLDKYVLLNFSTTNCGPCILSKDELKAIANKYQQKLTLVGFNADASRDTWLKGMRRDHPAWTVLWDGKGGHSETVAKYGVEGYPSFILLDPGGKIVHTWSGYSEGSILATLEKKLAL